MQARHVQHVADPADLPNPLLSPPHPPYVYMYLGTFHPRPQAAPLDMIRTRLMNQPAESKVYKGFLDCFMKVLMKEGPVAFYRGFFMIWMRFAPTTVLQLVIFEQLRGLLGMGRGLGNKTKKDKTRPKRKNGR